MSLSRLPLPSIDRILESEVDTNAKNASGQDNIDAAMTSSPSAPDAPLPAIVPQAHLMKTIDFRDNDLENEEVELFFLKVGFPDELPSDKDDAQTAFEEGRAVDVVDPPVIEQEQAPNRWLNLILAIRRLFPFRLAEVLLRKIGRELAQVFAQR
ncbi:hypothetical protein CPB84DRAFT_1842014 [Gymnopilus junonius]|uniref:Uncharacterized protein n=1 Tax=Gymnopilus junonius TaxID=109634 RepID=A0A9P5NX25_GYMJU|nr:hypothetical protein CPB84DRAFT_1842014 [Gymnopilus junonius]